MRNTDNYSSPFKIAVKDLKRITEDQTSVESNYSDEIKLEIMNLLLKLDKLSNEVEHYTKKINSTPINNTPNNNSLIFRIR